MCIRDSVIDMDWHRNGKTGSTDGTEWTGWSWNKALFPDPAGFISWLHDEQNLNTTLNLHPADGVFPKEDNYAVSYTHLDLFHLYCRRMLLLRQ